MMKVTGLVRIVVDEPGMTLAQAKAAAQANPEEHKCMFVEELEFESWDENLTQTEEDEPEEEEEEEEEEEGDGEDEMEGPDDNDAEVGAAILKDFGM